VLSALEDHTDHHDQLSKEKDKPKPLPEVRIVQENARFYRVETSGYAIANKLSKHEYNSENK
jgi:hypothetical protein